MTKAGKTLDLRQQRATTPHKAAASGALDLRNSAPAPTRRATPAAPVAVSTPPAHTSPVGKAVSAGRKASPTAAVATKPDRPAIPRSPMIKKLAQHPAVTKPTKQHNALPSHVATQIAAMRASMESLPPEPSKPQSPALQQALDIAKASTSNAPSILKISAAVAVIGIMASLVWMQNSPKLAFRNAATKVGIDASLPTYMPSSFKQKGEVSTANNRITLNYTSPSSSDALSITQQRTNWDSDSLRANYVGQKSNDYLAIPGQGLVIYLYGNQANWVNHGVWYQIAGTTKLSREQILRIAYGL